MNTAEILLFPPLRAHRAMLADPRATLDELTATTEALAADANAPLPEHVTRYLGRDIYDTRSLRQQRLDLRAATAARAARPALSPTPGAVPAPSGRGQTARSEGHQFPAGAAFARAPHHPTAPGPSAPGVFRARAEQILAGIALVMMLLSMGGAVYLAGLNKGRDLSACHLSFER